MKFIFVSSKVITESGLIPVTMFMLMAHQVAVFFYFKIQLLGCDLVS